MTGPGFFGQFIDEYFAECEEHLATARRVLLALETAAGMREAERPDPTLMRELFRSLHTLKGLAGMVGDSCAERTAHALEEALRAIERSGAAPRLEAVDALFLGVETLDRCVVARRAGAPEPEAALVLARLAAIATLGASTKQVDASHSEIVSAPPVAPATIVHFTFRPSAELSQRGVGVDAVRARLSALGRILDAKPRAADGGVVFDFRVEVSEGRHPDAAWSGDGVTWTSDEERAPSAPPGSGARMVTSRHGSDSGSRSNASVVRVDLTRVDAVMRLVGDLVTTRSRLDGLLRQTGGAESSAGRDALEETSAAMERQLRQLREGVMRLRLVQVGEVFERLRFAARDAIRESGKQVALVFHGETTEIDKLVVDRMLEPLLHLVRNSVSHGLESPAERVAHGKPAEGTLTLRAAASGDRIVIDVEDDGRGMDAERIAARARERGLLQTGDTLGPDRLLDVVCTPGFSTRDEADLTSGRGVGMDVVWSTVRALAGHLSMTTAAGRGTRFVIELPLTLLVVDALLVEIGGQRMAMPQPALREVVQIERSSIVSFESNEVVKHRGSVLPLVDLVRLFGLTPAGRDAAYVLVVGTDEAPIGLVVDRLIELREIVVHPITDPLIVVPGVSGATDLGDGCVSLILDAAALVRLAHERRDRRAKSRPSMTPPTLVRGAHSTHLSA